MTDKYVLYIDILGFSDLVIHRVAKVPALYQIIDSLHVHRHHAFTTVVFSDTVVVFNKDDPRNSGDDRYFVMYACEFAQDLMYRLVAKDIYFRAILTFGDFHYAELDNLRSFYGTALISAYHQQAAIQSIGLFIDADCQAHNRYYPTERCDEDLSFVYLNSSLETLHSVYQEVLPVDRFILEQTDELWRIGWDVRFLHDVHSQMATHPNPGVRAKHMAAWQYYKARYPSLLATLEDSSFDLRVICPAYDWTTVLRRIEEE